MQYNFLLYLYFIYLYKLLIVKAKYNVIEPYYVEYYFPLSFRNVLKFLQHILQITTLL
jgi:hypothetical protein